MIVIWLMIVRGLPYLFLNVLLLVLKCRFLILWSFLSTEEGRVFSRNMYVKSKLKLKFCFFFEHMFFYLFRSLSSSSSVPSPSMEGGFMVVLASSSLCFLSCSAMACFGFNAKNWGLILQVSSLLAKHIASRGGGVRWTPPQDFRYAWTGL